MERLIVGLVALLGAWPSFAGDTVTEAKQAREKIEKTENQSQDILNELYMIQKRVREISRSRERLNEMMLSSDGDAQSLAQSVSSLEKRLEEQRRQLAQRMTFVYRWNNPSLLPFLFSSSSANEFDRNLLFMRRLSERDLQYMRKFQTTLRMTHSQRAKLNSKVRALIVLKKKVEVEEAKMNDAFGQKSKLLAHLKNEREHGLKTLQELRRSHPELETTLNTGFFERRGSLMSPVAGEVDGGYGAVVDKTYWYRLLRKGWRFHARNESVKTVFNGEVAFAGRLPGYGSTIVIDHGDHYYSVYGSMDALSVASGAKVREGDVIGHSAQQLYFEIRHFSEAIDPAAWIKDANKVVAATPQSTGGKLQ